MATELKNVKRLYFTTEASATALGKQWWYAADTRRIGVMEADGTTKRYFWDSTRLADTGTTYGSKLIGTPGITGVTPDGGSSGAAATLQAMLAGLKAYSDSALVAGIGGTTGTLLKKTGSGAAGDSVLSENSGKIRFSGDTVANLYRVGAGHLITDGKFEAIGNIVTGAVMQTEYLEVGANGTFYGDMVVQEKTILQGALATPLLFTAAATLTLDATHHSILCSHATPVITLPLASSLPEGTEFWIYFHANSGTLSLSGSDAWSGLTENLGLGIEGDNGNIVGITTAAFVKCDGAGVWGYREIT